MANKFNIRENKGKYSLRQWQDCWHCKKTIDKDALYIDYEHGNYHLSCFKAYGEKLLKRWELFKKNIKINLNKLKPYQKEMICESLDKE